MKILGYLFILLLVIGLFTACSQAGDPGAAEAPPEPEAEAAVEEEAIYDPSEGLDDDGYWEGVSALDHVTLPQYKGLTIPKEYHEIPEEDLRTEIQYLLSYYATTTENTTGVISEGDTVNIDYDGSVDGVPFDGGSTRGNGTNVTIGVTNFIDDFLEQLIGHAPGENFDIEVTFPEAYGNETLNGKDAVFNITINHILETETPEWTDEFVAGNLAFDYGVETTEEMEAFIEDILRKSEITAFLDEYLISQSTVSTYPNGMMHYQEKSLVNHFDGTAQSLGLTFEEYLRDNIQLESVEELFDLYVEENTEIVKKNLVMQAIAEDAGITVTDEDVSQYFLEYMGLEDYSEYEGHFGMPYLKMTVMKQLVLNHITDHAILE
jgi:trigger factor